MKNACFCDDFSVFYSYFYSLATQKYFPRLREHENVYNCMSLTRSFVVVDAKAFHVGLLQRAGIIRQFYIECNQQVVAVEIIVGFLRPISYKMLFL